MAAVSGLFHGQVLDHQQNMDGDYNAWEYARTKSLEVH